VKKIIPYSRQLIDKQDILSVNKVLKSNFLTKGKVTIQFENEIKRFCGVKYVSACINASSGLILACKSINIKKNDIVWTTVNTYVATANCAIHCHAKVDFIDINLNDYNISISDLERKLKHAKKLKKLPKALIVVHLAGNPVHMKKIKILSNKYKFFVIEDASHAFGAKYYQTKIGDCKYSDICVFSFHPVKNITTAEGGAITTNNKTIHNKILSLRENGTISKFSKKNPNFYDVVSLGYNFRINEINSTLGISQIKKTKSYISKKIKLAKRYISKFKGKPVILPDFKKNFQSSWHLFILRIDTNKIKKNKKQIVDYLMKKNIYVTTHYIPLNTFSYFKNNYKNKDFKKAKLYYDTSFSIPLYPQMTLKEQDYVCNRIIEFLEL